MPKIVILGSCRHEPYEVLFMPNKLDGKLYAKDQDEAYEEACKVVYPAIEEADVILVYVPEGKIGKHTQLDINYAKKLGKTVTPCP